MEQHLNKIPDYLEHSKYYLINIKTGECTCFDYQRVLPAESKNLVIYNGDVEAAYSEIIDLYKTHDPFWTVELDYHKDNNGAPPKSSAKPRKPNRILKTTEQNISPSEQTRSTKRIRKNIQDAKRPSVLQSIQTSIDSSYVLSPTNLPISFPSTIPYYSNSTVPSNNYPPDQNPYSLSLTYFFNSSSFATSHNSSITASSTLNFSSSDNRQEENRLYYYV
ncbi:unnamed protein product [Rhizophagus irregularis]|nr:unnamed protein product [Rhizophagus irregularis]